MKCLVFFAPRINHDEFGKEARAFAKCHKVDKADVIPVSTFQPLMLRRWKVLRELKKREGQEYDAVVFFCHGWKNKIQLGFKRVSIPALARRLNSAAEKRLIVVLYACSCAKTGGIAELLRDELKEGSRVIGHSTSGHTTRNPYAVWYTKHLVDYILFVDWNKWKKHLKEDDDFRFRFPFMTGEQIEKELDSIE